MSRLAWLRKFRVDRCEGGRAFMLSTPWGWLEVSWKNDAEEWAFVEAMDAELTQRCLIQRAAEGELL